MSLTKQLEQAVDERERLAAMVTRYCQPLCKTSDWQDRAASGRTIATYCRVCGRWIGSRPASSKVSN